MKRSPMLLSTMICLSTFFLSGAVLSQETMPKPLFTVKTGSRTLDVLRDGSVTETGDDQTIQRRLLPGTMRKLDKLIANRPCQSDHRASRPTEGKEVTLRHVDTKWSDCWTGFSSTGFGMVELILTLHGVDEAMGSVPVYFVCDNLSKQQKESMRDLHQRFISRTWQRFLRDLLKASGSSGLLKARKCDAL